MGIVSGSITSGTTATPPDANGGSNPAPINVVKAGPGTWTLASANTYNGTTTINAGTLIIGASGSIAASPQIMTNLTGVFDVSAVAGFQLQSGQQLAGLGTVMGSVADAAGGVVIAPGYIDPSTSLNTPGALTFGTTLSTSNLKLNNGAGNMIKFDLAQTTSATSDYVVVTGNFINSTTNKVDLDISLLQPTINNGTYPLIKYGSYAYPAANQDPYFILSGVSLGRQTLHLNNNTTLNEIELVVAGGASANLTWVGGLAGNAWDVNTTANWTGSIDGRYFDGDLVAFDDTGSNSPNINLTSKLQPGSLTFNNNTENYTLGGGGYISGSTGLTINGLGKVTLANTSANDFTGAIAINSGTLQIGDGVNSGAIPNNRNILDNGTLIFDRPAADTLTYTGVISGSGAFVQQGANAVTMNVTNTYTGATSLLGGTLIVTSLANGGANSNIGASSNAAANLVLNGGTLQYTGTGATTDRLFTLGASGGTIDSSGTGILNFSNAGALAYTGSGPRTLTLTGTNASGELNASNNLAAVIGNGTGGATSVYKTGSGDWALSNYNTYSGGTTVNNGILWAYNQFPAGGGNNLPQTINTNTALGALTSTVTINSGGTLAIWGNAGGTWTTTLAGVTLNGGILMGDDGHETLNSPVNLTTDSTIMCRYWDKDFMITGNVTGSANLAINTPLPGGLPVYSWNYGVVILAGTGNSWTGTTTILSGGRSTLQIGNAGPGSLPVGAANTINLNGQLAFNTTNDITITNAAIVGSGTRCQLGLQHDNP